MQDQVRTSRHRHHHHRLQETSPAQRVTLYIRNEDIPLWDTVRKIAKATDLPLSVLVSDALKYVLEDQS